MQDENKKPDFDELGVPGQEMPGKSFLMRDDYKQKIVDIFSKRLQASQNFKKPRVQQWRKYDEMYNGAIKRKLRILFQIPLPVYSGMLDTMAASFDEPVELEFFKKHPADHFKAKKYQALWEMAKGSNNKNARWDYKSRIDKKTNIRYGRSILKGFAESDPKYQFILKTTDPYYFHCQPQGGGILENHLFEGEENVFKSAYDIRKGVQEGIYDADAWKMIQQRSASKDYMDHLGPNHEDEMGRFRSLGLDPDKDNYVGEERYNLAEMSGVIHGKRWYCLFDPWTKTGLRVCPLKEIYSKELYAHTTWASHEDDAVFWSIGYGDILYPIADSIITMFNQEMTNREKRNFGARAYDKDVFKDVAKLDSAQYRADALVPADTQGGAKKIGEAIYRFDTPELVGTVNLIDWVQQAAGKDTGITDTAQGASMQPTKKVNVAYMEQANIAKRIGYQSQPYTECWGEVGTRFAEGAKDHLRGKENIEILGEEGLEPDVMTREDIYTKNDLGVRVVSSTARKAEVESKKQGRIEGIKLLQTSQNVNSEMKDAVILRDIMGQSEAEIRQWFDTHNYASRDSMGKAHIAIQEMLDGDMPDINFAADLVFIKAINDYAIEHRNKLGKEKFLMFQKYIHLHMPRKDQQTGKVMPGVVQSNEVAKAKTRANQNVRRQALTKGAPTAKAPGKGGSKVAPARPAAKAVRPTLAPAPMAAASPEQVQVS